jgi:hypothetical protein
MELGLDGSRMSIKAKENADLKKLMDWHVKEANKCEADREFHIWAVTLISMIREIR